MRSSAAMRARGGLLLLLAAALLLCVAGQDVAGCGGFITLGSAVGGRPAGGGGL